MSINTSMAQNSSIDLDSAHRPFDNIINFRDVGASVNALCGARVLKEGVLFRSARLDDASERDRRRLVEELRIAAVVDLRSGTEHQMALEKASASAPDSAPEQDQDPDQTNAQDQSSAIPWTRYPISLTGKPFERALLWRLDWTNYLKTLTLATLGYRPSAVHLVCSQVMRPRGLKGLAEDTLEHSRAELKAVFDVLVSETAYPVLVHCTQGKDRTGLVVLLLLLLVGVDEGVVSGDYVKSEGELVVEMSERIGEIRALGLDEEFARCPPGFVGAVKSFLEERFGGVNGYLEGLGVDAERQGWLRGVLVA